MHIAGRDAPKRLRRRPPGLGAIPPRQLHHRTRPNQRSWARKAGTDQAGTGQRAGDPAIRRIQTDRRDRRAWILGIDNGRYQALGLHKAQVYGPSGTSSTLAARGTGRRRRPSGPPISPGAGARRPPQACRRPRPGQGPPASRARGEGGGRVLWMVQAALDPLIR